MLLLKGLYSGSLKAAAAEGAMLRLSQGCCSACCARSLLTAFLLLYFCFTSAYLLLYFCFTSALLQRDSFGLLRARGGLKIIKRILKKKRIASGCCVRW
jgi:hypothetical protein